MTLCFCLVGEDLGFTIRQLDFSPGSDFHQLGSSEQLTLSKSKLPYLQMRMMIGPNYRTLLNWHPARHAVNAQQILVLSLFFLYKEILIFFFFN